MGNYAQNNYNNGIGVGASASSNINYGVGVGYNAYSNTNYAVGIGANSNNNGTYGSALGAYAYAASSSTALGSYAKANAQQSVAIGNGTINNSTGTASFGTYAVNTSSNLFVSGNVGIGTTSPAARLDVQGSLGLGASFYQVNPTSGTWYSVFTDTAVAKSYIVAVEFSVPSSVISERVYLTMNLNGTVSSPILAFAGTNYTNITAQWSANDFQVKQNYGTADYIRATFIRLLR